MATNKRVFYACEAVLLQPLQYDGNGGYTPVGNFQKMLGVQSVGMTTNFNLEKVFTLGQLAQYDSVETNPELEVTLNKIFDGTAPLYMLCMGGDKWNTRFSLLEASNNRVNMTFGIYRDTSELTVSASGVSSMLSTGMYLQSVSFNFTTDGNATEDVTLVSSNKTWSNDAPNGITVEKVAPSIVRRWKFNIDDSDLPIGDGGMRPNSPLNSVTINADLNRDPVYTLGSYEPYDRSIQFPVEVTCEIESLAIDGDFLDLEEGESQGCSGSTSTTTVKNFPIKFVICGEDGSSSFSVDLGNKNKLNSISYGGGEAGGGNLTITYSFTTDNTLTTEVNGTYASTAGCTLVGTPPEKQC
jgi:hypothetical protein